MTHTKALKLALEALEADELDMVDDGSGNMVFRKEQSITAIKEALAQPVQEPVALVIDGVLVKSALPEKYTGHLYTAPPQREWVGLTDEELLHIGVATGLERAAAQMIADKLKEKNT